MSVKASKIRKEELDIILLMTRFDRAVREDERNNTADTNKEKAIKEEYEASKLALANAFFKWDEAK